MKLNYEGLSVLFFHIHHEFINEAKFFFFFLSGKDLTTASPSISTSFLNFFLVEMLLINIVNTYEEFIFISLKIALVINILC